MSPARTKQPLLCGPPRGRTWDILLKRELLYQLSYGRKINKCPRWESNPHPLRDTILSRARIPIPPLGQIIIHFIVFSNYNPSSERPGWESHPRIFLLQRNALLLGYQALIYNLTWLGAVRQFSVCFFLPYQ